MTHYINYIKDILGNNYLGINIPKTSIQLLLNELKEDIGDDDYDIFTDTQQRRDNGDYHITVINVAEYNKISNNMGMDVFTNSLTRVFKYGIDDLKLMGIGTASRNENRAYFIVCNSEKLDAIRTRFELPKKDFHITIGFLFKDVFGVRKNQVMEKGNKFLKLLSQEFYKNNNCNFVKRIENYDLDSTEEVVPIKISNSIMKVSCDGYFMDIKYLPEGEKFWIVTKYPVNQDLPRLPETEINKILKNKNE
jgi:hypothetical protein